MRTIGTTIWVSAVLLELGACGPRVSVGDLGADGKGGADAVQFARLDKQLDLDQGNFLVA